MVLEYYNEITIYFIFYLLQGDYSLVYRGGLGFRTDCPKLGVPFWEVPIVRAIVFWGL